MGSKQPVREDPSPYGTPANRATCETYFRARLDEAEETKSPNAYPHLYAELLKHFPPGYLDHLFNLPEIDLGAAEDQPGETESRRRRSS